MAKWIYITNSDSAVFHFDVDALRENNEFVKIWELVDFEKINEFGDLSSKDLKEFHCTNENSRTLSNIYYSGKMGSGNINSSSNKPSNWKPIAPETVNQQLWKVACGKEKISEAALSTSKNKWTLISQSETLKMYADISTKLQNDKNLIILWVLADHNLKKTSLKTLDIIDCNNGNYKSIKSASFSENMEQGNITLQYDDEYQDWLPIVPETIYGDLAKQICTQSLGHPHEKKINL